MKPTEKKMNIFDVWNCPEGGLPIAVNQWAYGVATAWACECFEYPGVYLRRTKTLIKDIISIADLHTLTRQNEGMLNNIRQKAEIMYPLTSIK